MEKTLLDTVAGWIGRTVTIEDSDRLTGGLSGVVLAVDDTPWAPSAWVKFQEGRDHPMYRSCDLSDLTDIETGEAGMRWGTGGPEADMANLRARIAERNPA